VAFQTDPKTGDSRVSGTTASLAGLEAGDPLAVSRIVLAHSIILSSGGIPLLYLGDEVGQLNDYEALEDPARRDDSRWVGRPPFPEQGYLHRHDETSDAGRLYTRLMSLIEIRQGTTALAGNRLVIFHTDNPHVLGYQRFAPDGSLVLVLANFSDSPQRVEFERFGALAPIAVDLISRAEYSLVEDVVLEPLGMVWLAVPPSRA